jgi:lipopolysaccharide transport protein LptA
MRRRSVPTAALWLGASLSLAAGAGAEEPAGEGETKIVIRFRADKMVLGPDMKTATLTGHVKVTVSDVTITCRKLKLAYESGEKVASFAALGDVELVMDELKATADRLDYDARARKAVLGGGCKVVSRSVKLSGETISIEIDSRKIAIEKASGTIDISNETF